MEEADAGRKCQFSIGKMPKGMADIDGNFQNVIPGTGQEHIVPAGINDMDLAFPLDFIRKERESRGPFCRMALTDILDVLFKEER